MRLITPYLLFLISVNKSICVILLLCFIKAGAQTSALAVGDSLVQTGAYSEAIEVYNQLPVSPQVYERIAAANEALGRNAEALAAYRSALELNADDFRLGYRYGILLSKSNYYKKADSLFSGLHLIQPTNASVLYQRGYAREQLKDSTAIIDYLKAYRADNNQQNALYRIAKLLLEKRSFVGAKEYIDLGLKANPNSTRFLLLDGLSYFVNKSYHDAIKRFERLLELGKDNESIREHLAKSYAQTYQYEQALEQYKVLINQYDDRNANWHFSLSTAYLGLNEPEKARRHINIAIGLLDVPLDSHFLALAITYNREGNYPEVMKALQEALAENPKNQLAKYQLAVAADNRYADKALVLPYYEAYSKQFPKGRFIDTVLYRISDIKEQLFMEKD